MNRIAVGAVTGLVLALIIFLRLGGVLSGVVLPVVLNGAAGAAIGFLAERFQWRLMILVAGAVIGMVVWAFIGRGVGPVSLSLLLGALVGLSIAAVVSYWGRRQTEGAVAP